MNTERTHTAEEHAPEDWDGEGLEGDDDVTRCSMFVDGGRFVCGAVGSEDCDECPFHSDLGKTPSQVESEMEEAYE